MKPRTIVIAVLLAALAVAPVPGQEPTPVDAAREALARAERQRQALEIEMIKAYRKIRADFDRLRSGEGPALRKALSELAQDVVAATPEGEGRQLSVSRTLRSRLGTSDLLSAPIADRFARAVAERVVRFSAEPARASDAALDEIFPGEDIDEIWDSEFVDLDTVVKWREVNVAVELRKLELEGLLSGDEEKIPAPPGMVRVPGGKFTFGPHEAPGWPTKPAREHASYVTLEPYFIDRHEVTNKQYAEFLEEQPEKDRPGLVPGSWTGEPPAFHPGKELYPVTGVTFSQARAYAEWAGKRLPTEREWEKAARGAEEGFVWPWGDEFDREALVWGGNRAVGPARILSRPKDRSPFLVLDMAGNVSEWTTTLEHGKKEVRSKVKDTDLLVIRGGSFRTTDKVKTRSYYRWVLNAETDSRDDVGFRCVIDEDVWRRRAR